jgi:hypothetical protein
MRFLFMPFIRDRDPIFLPLRPFCGCTSGTGNVRIFFSVIEICILLAFKKNLMYKKISVQLRHAQIHKTLCFTCNIAYRWVGS